MRFGVLADIHSNRPALEAGLDALRAAGAERFICPGDIVGYGPDPDDCVDAVRRLRCAVVAGNHDYGAVGRISTERFNTAARQALEWTRTRLSESNRLYLDNLPLTEELDSTRIVHAGPSAPDHWEYVFSLREAEDEMRAFSSAVCFIGHSHYPFAVESSPTGKCRLLRQPGFELRPGHKYLVNPGSVGQPRDGDPRASCLLYDDTAGTITFLRVDYDCAPVQRRIRAAGLPDFLAARIAIGR